jgi:hypothetical protein
MLFEIQRACPRPGQSRVIASGPSAIKTLAALTSLRPNTKIEIIPSETKKDSPVPKIEPDEDDITLAELKEQLEDNMTLAELQEMLLEEEEEEEDEPIEWVDEMTYYSRTCGELRNF